MNPVDRAHEVDRDRVFRVDRKEVLDPEPAASAIRQAIDVLGLHQEVRHVVRLLLGGHLRIADGEAADRRGRVRVALDQHGRDSERAGDVVEPEARVVAGQKLLRVDVQREQIADGVRVFRAVQPVQRRPAGIRRACGEPIELGLEVRDELLLLLLVRPRFARRRHHARPELAHDLLPLLGRSSDLVDVQAVEVEPGEQRARALGLLAMALVARALEERMRRRRRLRAGGPRHTEETDCNGGSSRRTIEHGESSHRSPKHARPRVTGESQKLAKTFSRLKSPEQASG